MLTDAFRNAWSAPEIERTITENIERFRKSDAAIALTDIHGNKLSGAEVNIQQVSHDFLFGSNAFALGQLETPEANAKYEEAFLKLFNSATIPFYWRTTEPTEGELRYEEGSRHIWRRPPADRVLSWCKQNNLIPKGHPIMWHEFNPGWLPKDPEKVKGLFLKRFHEMAERYGEDIILWDGVNEPIACLKDFALYSEDLAYVAWSFREERKIFPPQAQLMINEMPHICHEYDGPDGTETRYYKHIKGLVDDNVPLDGIGFQFHIMSEEAVDQILDNSNYGPQLLLDVYELYDKFELPMYVTEITMPTMAGRDGAEEFQNELVRNYCRLWFSIPRMEGITWWNLGDGTAIEHEAKFQGGLLRKDLEPKPSFHTLDRLINHEWKTDLSLKSKDDGLINFRGFHGKYQVSIKTGAFDRVFEINLKPGGENRFKLAVW